MNISTHFLTSWLLANADASATRKERMLVTVAGIAPDLDGLGLVVDIANSKLRGDRSYYWYGTYHHDLAHNLLFALVMAGGVWAITKRKWKTAGLAFVAVHLHLFEDLLGSAGRSGAIWDIPYLLPFTHGGTWSWKGQWYLDGWQNMVVTAVAFLAAMALARMRGYSFIEVFSPSTDASMMNAFNFKK